MFILRIIFLIINFIFINYKLKSILNSNINNQSKEIEEIEEIEEHTQLFSESFIHKMMLIMFLLFSTFYLILWIFIAIISPFHPFWLQIITAIATLISIINVRHNSMNFIKISDGNKDSLKFSIISELMFLLDLIYLIFATIILIIGFFIGNL